MDEWGRQLSYYGIIPWLILATPFMLMIGGWSRMIYNSPVARAHLAFFVFQFVGLFISTQEFGNEGFLAGMYILAVSLSFMYIYIFGVYLGGISNGQRLDGVAARGITILTWTMLPTMAIALMQLVTGTGRDVGGIMRVYGGTSSPNVMAAMLLVFAGILMWSSRVRLSALRRVIIFVAIALLVACFSMSGMVAFVFSLALYVVIRARAAGTLKLRFSWIVAAILGIYLLILFAENVLALRLSELGQDDNSLTWRTRTWLSYLDFLSEPTFLMLGGGLGFDHLGLDQEPHNEWLRVLLETGLVGLFLFARIWWKLLRSLWQIAKQGDLLMQRQACGMIAVTGGLLLWAAVDSVLRTAPSALLLWGAAGMLVGMSQAHLNRGASAQKAPRQLPRRASPSFARQL